MFQALNCPERAIWKLVELYTNLDLAQLATIIDSDAVLAFGPGHWDGTTHTLGEHTNSLSIPHCVDLRPLIYSR